MSDDWDDYETGPFCRHWDHPSDCTEPCMCGHHCRWHAGGDCNVDDCQCLEFEEAKR